MKAWSAEVVALASYSDVSTKLDVSLRWNSPEGVQSKPTSENPEIRVLLWTPTYMLR
jgi:hypothetical protein